MNCFQISTEDTVVVDTMPALAAAINAAAPGAQITIAAGTYTGGTRTFNPQGTEPQGTEANPIVVRPANNRGDVIINDAAWTLADTSARLVITNIHFNNAQIDINGSHHRIARCQFRDIGRYCIRVFTASDTRISHCDFSDYRSTTAIAKGCIQFDGRSMAKSDIQGALIDYCHIHDIRQDVDVDPSNPLQIGTAGGSWRRKLGIIVDHCLLDNIGRIGSSEVIVCKTSELTIRHCTFTNMSGHGKSPVTGKAYASQYIQQRQGGGIEVRSCWFECPLIIHNCETVPAPVRAPLIIGNHMAGGNIIRCAAGNNLEGQNGATKPGPYFACVGGRFIGNELESGVIQVGTISGGVRAPNTPARDNNIVTAVAAGVRRNIRTAGDEPHTLRLHSGTTFVDDTAPDNDGNAPPAFVPAEKLEASQVGLDAPDPLCRSGPQN